MSKKRPRSKKTSASVDPIMEARAEKSVANLREHYERGQKANRDAEKYSPRELAQRFKINSHTLRKERRFARRYSETELEELLSLRRPDGMPVHWGHVIYLITINRKSDRKRLQNQVAKEGWQAPELYAAIQKQYQDGSGRGGRPVKIPQSAQGKLRLMVEETERWLRRYEAVCGANGQNLLDGLDGADKDSLKKRRQALSKDLERMSQVAGELAQGLRRSRRKTGRRA
jgi:hypothetical protein